MPHWVPPPDLSGRHKINHAEVEPRGAGVPGGSREPGTTSAELAERAPCVLCPGPPGGHVSWWLSVPGGAGCWHHGHPQACAAPSALTERVQLRLAVAGCAPRPCIPTKLQGTRAAP